MSNSIKYLFQRNIIVGIALILLLSGSVDNVSGVEIRGEVAESSPFLWDANNFNPPFPPKVTISSEC